MSDRSERPLTHQVESVKILPPGGFDPSDPRNYGPLTQSAIALPEIAAPDRTRIYCMAVTNEDVSGSIPSGWSAAIDQAAASKMIGNDDEAPKRLIIVSGGNALAHIETARLQHQDNYPIEDPAQAWNALTVGGYTDLTEVRDAGLETWTALAAAGDLSPHGRTSAIWPQTAPSKPEIVMEAGNRAISPAGTDVLTVSSLSLLSTGRDTARAPLVSFEAANAAAALAAKMAARLDISM